MDRTFENKMPRDYRIDFFRGLALISIFVNHVPGNFYSNFTQRNFGLSDAAEVFVLLAGMSAALAYFPRFVTGRAALSVGLVGKRIATLYVAHLSAIVAGFAIYAAAAIWLADPGIMIPDERRWIVEKPVEAILGMGGLTYQTGNFNILPMYMVMMALLPVIMLLARVRLGLALAASFALWLAANVFRLGLPNYPSEGLWYFNPFTWQLVFTIGFVAGVRLRRGQAVPRSGLLLGASIVYLALSLMLVFGALWDYFPPLPQWVWLSGFDKSWLGVFRVLHLLALGYVVVMSPLPAWLQGRLGPGNWIVGLGRNTLPIFWTGTLLAVTGHVVRYNVFGFPNDPTFTPGGILLDTALIGTGVVVLFVLSHLIDWTKSDGRGERSRAAATGKLAGAPTPAE